MIGELLFIGIGWSTVPAVIRYGDYRTRALEAAKRRDALRAEAAERGIARARNQTSTTWHTTPRRENRDSVQLQEEGRQ